MEKNELKQIIREELIKETLSGNILSFIAGYLMKGLGNNSLSRKKAEMAVSQDNVKKAADDLAKAHAKFNKALDELEAQYPNVKFSKDIRQPYHL